MPALTKSAAPAVDPTLSSRAPKYGCSPESHAEYSGFCPLGGVDLHHGPCPWPLAGICASLLGARFHLARYIGVCELNPGSLRVGLSHGLAVAGLVPCTQ